MLVASSFVIIPSRTIPLNLNATVDSFLHILSLPTSNLVSDLGKFSQANHPADSQQLFP